MTPLDVRVLDDAQAAIPLLITELQRACARSPRPLISFATGATFTGFLRALEQAAGELLRGAVATHLDEYLGFAPSQRGGMVHELTNTCPVLMDMLARGTFVPVPASGDAAAIDAHEARLARTGGVELQLLGIGRNGHLAFNEPGAPADAGFHVTRLADTTRQDARARFAPDEPPTHAVTAGLGSILAARRVVLCAFGANKRAAVHAMLHGEPSPACPASALRRHANVLVLLDRDATG